MTSTFTPRLLLLDSLLQHHQPDGVVGLQATISTITELFHTEATCRSATRALDQLRRIGECGAKLASRAPR